MPRELSFDDDLRPEASFRDGPPVAPPSPLPPPPPADNGDLLISWDPQPFSLLDPDWPSSTGNAAEESAATASDIGHGQAAPPALAGEAGLPIFFSSASDVAWETFATSPLSTQSRTAADALHGLEAISGGHLDMARADVLLRQTQGELPSSQPGSSRGRDRDTGCNAQDLGRQASAYIDDCRLAISAGSGTGTPASTHRTYSPDEREMRAREWDAMRREREELRFAVERDQLVERQQKQERIVVELAAMLERLSAQLGEVIEQKSALLEERSAMQVSRATLPASVAS
jgi:hypothetical protein